MPLLTFRIHAASARPLVLIGHDMLACRHLLRCDRRRAIERGRHSYPRSSVHTPTALFAHTISSVWWSLVVLPQTFIDTAILRLSST